MGLVLVAHYYERVDALVAKSVVEGAGVAAFLPNFDVLTLLPDYTMAFGGYRLLVVEGEVEAAVFALRHAQTQPASTDERLFVEGDFLDRVLSLVVGWFAGGAPAPIRQRRWQTLA
jgi:hypothetical protein